jgi:hypothetical protein
MNVLFPPANSPTGPADKPKVIHSYRRNARLKAPCPHCGQPGHRLRNHSRTVRGIAYHAILLVHITVGEYQASCACCTTFRTTIEDIEPKAKYVNQVREAVLDRLLDDRMSLAQIQQALQRDFHLDLSSGFLYDCLDWQVQQCDAAAYRQWTLAHFSGTLCIDEIHLGGKALLLATDPLNDFPVAFALVAANDQAHMERFLNNLKAHGFLPRVVVTDGSNLYPALLAVIWPHAEHQLCIFHVLQDIHKHVLDALRRRQRRLKRRGNRGRKRRRGRPRRQTRRGRQALKLKDKAAFVFKHRYLIVRRRESLTENEAELLATMCAYEPGLVRLRQFVDRVQELFAAEQTPAQARQRWQDLRQQADYLADTDLAQAVALLEPTKFEKMIAFLRSPLGQRVRTNNHVERSNRQLRLYEKVRYKWRQRRSIVRFVVLLIHRVWRKRLRSPEQVQISMQPAEAPGQELSATGWAA